MGRRLLDSRSLFKSTAGEELLRMRALRHVQREAYPRYVVFRQPLDERLYSPERWDSASGASTEAPEWPGRRLEAQCGFCCTTILQDVWPKPISQGSGGFPQQRVAVG